MNSEDKLRTALAAYRDALGMAQVAVQAALEALKGDVLATTLQPFQVLQQASWGSVDKAALEAAIKALDERTAAMQALTP